MMGTKSKQQRAGGKQNKSSYWKHLIKEWQDSGLTQKEFCLARQVKRSTFQYWKTRLKKEAQSKSLLLPVTISPEIKSNAPDLSSGITFKLGEKFSIQLDESFNSQTLSKLIDLLEARVCSPII